MLRLGEMGCERGRALGGVCWGMILRGSFHQGWPLFSRNEEPLSLHSELMMLQRRSHEYLLSFSPEALSMGAPPYLNFFPSLSHNRGPQSEYPKRMGQAMFTHLSHLSQNTYQGHTLFSHPLAKSRDGSAKQSTLQGILYHHHPSFTSTFTI